MIKKKHPPFTKWWIKEWAKFCCQALASSESYSVSADNNYRSNYCLASQTASQSTIATCRASIARLKASVFNRWIHRGLSWYSYAPLQRYEARLPISDSPSTMRGLFPRYRTKPSALTQISCFTKCFLLSSVFVKNKFLFYNLNLFYTKQLVYILPCENNTRCHHLASCTLVNLYLVNISCSSMTSHIQSSLFISGK